jgi:hypothetical protein
MTVFFSRNVNLTRSRTIRSGGIGGIDMALAVPSVPIASSALSLAQPSRNPAHATAGSG